MFPKRKNKLHIYHFLFPPNVDTLYLVDKSESYANIGKADLGISEKFVFKGTLPRTLNPALDLCLILIWSARRCFLSSKYLLENVWHSQKIKYISPFMRFTTDCQCHLIIESPWNQQSYTDIIRKADVQTSKKRNKSKKTLFIFYSI